MCQQYYQDYYVTMAVNQVVSIFIIGTNYILRLVIIWLIYYIGKDTESE
jgi:hypothetical protein